MDITFYSASFNEETPSKCSVVSISDELFLRLASSAFSKIGDSKKINLNLDGELIERRLVELADVREYLLSFCYNLLPSIVEENLEKMGESPSSSEFQFYKHDIETVLTLLKFFKDDSFSHLERTSG